MSSEPKHLPPPARRGAPPPAAPALSVVPSGDRFAVSSGRVVGAERVMLYGPGGIGKTNLAALAPNPVFLDIEDGSKHLEVSRITGLTNWTDLRSCLQSNALDGFQTIVLDSVTRAEEWAIAHTLATVPHEKGNPIVRLEDYGFGKGFQHVYDVFGLILPDFDRHIRAGRNVVLIAHDVTADVPNPSGEDFLRYEPHLQAPKSGKASIRERVFQWVDHVLFLSYDVIATKDGKGKGGGSRTIWPVERPDHRAKSRSIADPLVYENANDGAIWTLILGGAP
jgi:hypothetical protein